MNTIKTLLAAIAVIVAFTLNATSPLCPTEINQNDTTHLKFLGLEIDGDPNIFCEALIKKGFKMNPHGKSNQAKFLTGRFAGKDNCLVIVDFSPELNLTYSVTVSIEGTKSFYNTLIGQLKQKYSDAEHSSLVSTSNNFYLPNGFIAADFTAIDGVDTTLILYVDQMNREKSQQQAFQDL